MPGMMPGICLADEKWDILDCFLWAAAPTLDLLLTRESCTAYGKHELPPHAGKPVASGLPHAHLVNSTVNGSAMTLLPWGAIGVRSFFRAKNERTPITSASPS